MPVEIPNPIAFDLDTQHASYDREYVTRFWRILLAVDNIFQEFRSRLHREEQSGAFLLGKFRSGVTRFSGRRAPEREGADPITREAYSHEVISAGFWPGGGEIKGPAFYVYAAPEPAGYGQSAVRPAKAFYHSGMKEFFLMYDDVRAERLAAIGAARISAKHLRCWGQPGQMGPGGTGTDPRRFEPSFVSFVVSAFRLRQGASNRPGHEGTRRNTGRSQSPLGQGFRLRALRLSKVFEQNLACPSVTCPRLPTGPIMKRLLIVLWPLRLSIPRPATRSRHWCSYSARARPRRYVSACTTIRREVRGGLPARPNSIYGTANERRPPWSTHPACWTNFAVPPTTSTNSPRSWCKPPRTWLK